MKIYFLRHQAAGIVTKYPFVQPPTEAQIAAVARELFQEFGASHPTKGHDYWLKVIEQDALGPTDVPDVPVRSLSVAGALAAETNADVSEVSVSAVASVQNP